MRKIFALAAAVASIPSLAAAQNVTTGFYAELGIGLSLIQDVKTEPFSLGTPLGTLSGTFDTEYSSPQGVFGAEVGFAAERWRFGIGYDWMDAPIDKASFSGTFNGSPLNVDISKSDLKTLGVETDSAFMIAAGNIYYKLSPPNSPIEPYLGVGAGAAFAQNASTELALSATAGARFAITRRAYVGARYRFTYIGGPKSDDGLKYEDVLIHMISVQLGMYFGSS